jgi:hypothetical protein
MRKFILGILIGGLLLSGGWFAWGAIQQEVGITFLNSATGAWVRATGAPPGSSDGEGIYVLPGGGYMPVGSDVTSDTTNIATTNGSILSRVLSYEFDGTDWNRKIHSWQQQTENVNANGAGTIITMTSSPTRNTTLMVNRTIGATNAVDIRLECKVHKNSSTFVSIGSITDLTNEPVISANLMRVCSAIRYNVVTVGAGNTHTIEIISGAN